MQFVFSLIALFLMGSMLYGLYAGVRTVVRVVSQVTSAEAKAASSAKMAAPLKGKQVNSFVDDLQTLFVLYEKGVLTKNEFEHLKKHVLESVSGQKRPGF